MVAEQRETVQRIDADVVDIASNVGGAQRELLKYYASIANNRWLMLKIFGVLIVFVRLMQLLSLSVTLTSHKVSTIYTGFLMLGQAYLHIFIGSLHGSVGSIVYYALIYHPGHSYVYTGITFTLDPKFFIGHQLIYHPEHSYNVCINPLG